MKKRIATVSVVLVLACAIVALYMYIDRSEGKETPKVNTVAEQILSKDLEKNYPPTPYSVAELYCGIVECIYSSSTTEEQLEDLVRKQIHLFDDEFAALNPYEQYLAVTKDELEAAKDKNLVFTGYVLDKASNVEKWENDSGKYASLQLQFMMRSKDGSGASYRKLIMRKDSNGNYKILGWQTAEDGGNDSADSGN